MCGLDRAEALVHCCRYSGMAFASSKENPCLGVKITEGQGNLPKVVLASSQGRYVFLGFIFQFLIFTLYLFS